jgi:hypothetical protein
MKNKYIIYDDGEGTEKKQVVATAISYKQAAAIARKLAREKNISLVVSLNQLGENNNDNNKKEEIPSCYLAK